MLSTQAFFSRRLKFNSARMKTISSKGRPSCTSLLFRAYARKSLIFFYKNKRAKSTLIQTEFLHCLSFQKRQRFTSINGCGWGGGITPFVTIFRVPNSDWLYWGLGWVKVPSLSCKGRWFHRCRESLARDSGAELAKERSSSPFFLSHSLSFTHSLLVLVLIYQYIATYELRACSTQSALKLG